MAEPIELANLRTEFFTEVPDTMSVGRVAMDSTSPDDLTVYGVFLSRIGHVLVDTKDDMSTLPIAKFDLQDGSVRIEERVADAFSEQLKADINPSGIHVATRFHESDNGHMRFVVSARDAGIDEIGNVRYVATDDLVPAKKMVPHEALMLGLATQLDAESMHNAAHS